MIAEEILHSWFEVEAPWKSLAMVEQDLVITRVLVELYSQTKIRETLAFRGGTALNKLYIKPPARYSEDIDLVQIKAEPIGETIDLIRSILDPWLGAPSRKLTNRSVKLVYKYSSIDGIESKLKIEINTTEHFHLLDLKLLPLGLKTKWFSGETQILSYQLEELTASKLKALYQRRKGRDLFDMWLILSRNLVDLDLTVRLLEQHCAQTNEQISRALFERNLLLKREHHDFNMDMQALLSVATDWDFSSAFELIMTELIPRLKGEAWKGIN